VNKDLHKTVVIVTSDVTCDFVYRKLSDESKKVIFPGMAVIIDEKENVIGVVTDGDFRRAYSKNIDFGGPISEVMNADPLSMNSDDFFQGNYEQYLRWQSKYQKKASNCLLLDARGALVDVIISSEIDKKILESKTITTIYGMGFVGLTLAAHISSRGQFVIGLDRLTDLISALNEADTKTVHEPGLPQLISDGLANDTLTFENVSKAKSANFHIIAVGTPIDNNGVADLSALEDVTAIIGKTLRQGDHVMLRSTVPAGTTRKHVIPMLEKLSGLEVGADFHVTFAPERTSEGAALAELRSLPQVIGSATAKCSEKASRYWTSLNNSVIIASSLEEAELVKLANNTFRDVSFAFANELALLADKFNVNAFSLIAAANEGYTRNNIALPSPGVGGYCLNKDPLLYHYSHNLEQGAYSFGQLSREVNENIKKYPINVLMKYADYTQKNASKMKVLLVGMAFKGYPETTDLRGSISVDLLHEIRDLVEEVSIFDWVIPTKELKNIHPNTSSAKDLDLSKYDAIFFMNNHESNVKIEPMLLKNRSCLVFDGWGQLNKEYIEKNSKVSYSSMGYISFAK
tara:strand:+ start:394 stop:2115 length:1722 start_codon:yes stop_codon:yes gene_type:complete